MELEKRINESFAQRLTNLKNGKQLPLEVNIRNLIDWMYEIRRHF